MPRTVKGVPQKHSAGKQPSANFINPRIVEVHPRWLVGSEVAGLGRSPNIDSRALEPTEEDQ